MEKSLDFLWPVSFFFLEIRVKTNIFVEKGL